MIAEKLDVQESVYVLANFPPEPKRKRPAVADLPNPNKEKRDVSLKAADRRLCVWADWAKQHRQMLGWSSISSLYYAMMEAERSSLKSMRKDTGLRSAQGNNTRSFREDIDAVPEPIAEVDAVVARLPRPLNRVVTANYFTYGSIEIRAKACGHKRSRFSQLLESAKYAVWVGLGSLPEKG